MSWNKLYKTLMPIKKINVELDITRCLNIQKVNIFLIQIEEIPHFIAVWSLFKTQFYWFSSILYLTWRYLIIPHFSQKSLWYSISQVWHFGKAALHYGGLYIPLWKACLMLKITRRHVPWRVCPPPLWKACLMPMITRRHVPWHVCPPPLWKACLMPMITRRH